MTFPCLRLLVSPLMYTLPALRLPSAPASFPALCSNTFAPWQQQQKFVQALPIYPLCSWLWTVLYPCPTLPSLDSWLSAGNPALFTPRIPSPVCCSVAWSGALVEDRGGGRTCTHPPGTGKEGVALAGKGLLMKGFASRRREAMGGGRPGRGTQGHGGVMQPGKRGEPIPAEGLPHLPPALQGKAGGS